MFELNADVQQHLYLMGISLVFGLGQWMMKIRKNEIKKNKFDFFSEILFAELAGYITFRICQYFLFGPNMTFILVAINSWSGSKFLDVFQKISTNFIANKFGIDARQLQHDDIEVVAYRQRMSDRIRNRSPKGDVPFVRPHDHEIE